MGIYRALRLAILHPRRFRAAARLSGEIFHSIVSANAVTTEEIRMFNGAFGKPFAPDIYNRLNFFTMLPTFKKARSGLVLFIFIRGHAVFRLYDGAVNLYLPRKRLRIPM